MTDLVALFREQTEVLRLQQQSHALDRPPPPPPTRAAAPAVLPMGPAASPALASTAGSGGTAVLEAVAKVSGFPAETLQPESDAG